MEEFEVFKTGNFLRPNDRFIVPKIIKPKVDEYVSKIVGKDVLALDPRLLRLITKWKMEKKKPMDSLEQDRFFDDPIKIKELKETFQ